MEYGHTSSLFAEDEINALRTDVSERQIPDDYVSEILPPSGKKLEVSVNKTHAHQVLDTLMTAYESSAPPYDQDRVRLPHDPRHMPETLERGSVDHAMFLFNICYYMRGGIKSNDAVKRMSTIYDAHPQLFNCEQVLAYKPAEIAEVLTHHGLGFQETVSQQWLENSQRMLTRYDGDPRKIFDTVTTYEQSQALIQNDGKGKGFMGFQEKMTSMIIYYLADEGLIDHFNFPIPVDLHVMRVSTANEMITFGDAPHGTNLYQPETTAALRELYENYADEKQVDARRLCNATWMLSESLCGMNPGNGTKEPHGRAARDGRSTYLVPNKVDVNDPAQQNAYEKSCRICPLQRTCKFNIPGTPYYVAGSLIIRGERLEFPPLPEQGTQESLF